jgi:hypothetical protein
MINYKSLENQFIYPIPKGSKLIFFAPLGAGVNEENHWIYMFDNNIGKKIYKFSSVKTS